MSRAYKCDRCGGYFDPGDQGEIKNNVYDVYVGNTTGDLCPKCRDDLYRWYKLKRERLGENEQAKTMTNADRIRSMTDEELAKWLTEEGQPGNMCAPEYYCDQNSRCSDGVLLWLKQEAKNDAL